MCPNETSLDIQLRGSPIIGETYGLSADIPNRAVTGDVDTSLSGTLITGAKWVTVIAISKSAGCSLSGMYRINVKNSTSERPPVAPTPVRPVTIDPEAQDGANCYYLHYHDHGSNSYGISACISDQHVDEVIRDWYIESGITGVTKERGVSNGRHTPPKPVHSHARPQPTHIPNIGSTPHPTATPVPTATPIPPPKECWYIHQHGTDGVSNDQYSSGKVCGRNKPTHSHKTSDYELGTHNYQAWRHGPD